MYGILTLELAYYNAEVGVMQLGARNADGAKHAFTMDSRERCSISGVSDVECFNEQLVAVNTSSGAMTLTGEGLNIVSLELTEGKLVIEGTFNAVEYSGRTKRGEGLIGRLFK